MDNYEVMDMNVETSLEPLDSVNRGYYSGRQLLAATIVGTAIGYFVPKIVRMITTSIANKKAKEAEANVVSEQNVSDQT